MPTVSPAPQATAQAYAGTPAPLTKRQLAGLALRQIADFLEAAPRFKTYGRPYTADEMMQALVTGTDTCFMSKVERDPSAFDGLVDYCMVCHSDHDSNCPVGMLVWLAEHGVDSAVPVPPNMGLRGVR